MRRLRLLVWSLVTLNSFDAVSTVTAVQLGIAHEENPLMRALLALSPVSFVVFKLAFGGLLLGVLYLRAKPDHLRPITWTMYGLNGLYGVIFLQHIRVWVSCLWL